MKKFMFIAAMVMMFSNAAMANVESAQTIDYTFKVSNRSISRFLKLDEKQADVMAYICDRFNNDLNKVKAADESKRTALLQKALTYNLSAAHRYLTEEQFHLYLSMLNSTMKSKGLDTLLMDDEVSMAK